VPPSSMCLTIEKVANAVVEYGRSFEETLKNDKQTKEDPLFCFLQLDNIYHLYYNQRFKEAMFRKLTEIRLERNLKLNKNLLKR